MPLATRCANFPTSSWALWAGTGRQQSAARTHTICRDAAEEREREPRRLRGSNSKHFSPSDRETEQNCRQYPIREMSIAAAAASNGRESKLSRRRILYPLLNLPSFRMHGDLEAFPRCNKIYRRGKLPNLNLSALSTDRAIDPKEKEEEKKIGRTPLAEC